jgi:phage terminase large subunit-like protein
MQYFDPKYLTFSNGDVRYKNNKLNVFCAMDVAWSDSNLADYTAIAVVGVDHEGFYYVLDLDRFKTTKFHIYYEAAVSLQSKWGFRRMKVESNAGGKLVAQEIENLVRKNGGNLVIDCQHSSGHMGKKQERWAAMLEPKYESKSVFHTKGGLTQIYEEELFSSRPRHDDLKDAVCMAIEISKVPSGTKRLTVRDEKDDDNVVYLNKRFGGRMKFK